MAIEIINLRRLVCCVLLACCIQDSFAQQFEWNLSTKGFFDNSEGDEAYRLAQTHGGTRICPEIGISWDENKHIVMGGYSGLMEWGAKDDFTDGVPVIYYRYQTEPLTFTIGSFQREKLLGKYPSYLFSDTIRYYYPVFQGFAFQHQHRRGHAEFFLDWTGLRTDADREQFMAGWSVKHVVGKLREGNSSQFYLGTEGYYYHYALPWVEKDGKNTHDNAVAHPFVGYQWQDAQRDASVDVTLGALMSFDRERGMEDGKFTPVGFLGELSAQYKRWQLAEIFYTGDHQQPFGGGYLGKYYWGDTYYQASAYSRTDVKYQFLRSDWADAYAGAIFHITSAGFNWHQVLTLRVNIGSRQFAKSH